MAATASNIDRRGLPATPDAPASPPDDDVPAVEEFVHCLLGGLYDGCRDADFKIVDLVEEGSPGVNLLETLIGQVSAARKTLEGIEEYLEEARDRAQGGPDEPSRGDVHPGVVKFHFVIEDGWLHSHGMEAADLPEVEVRDVPAFLVDAASSLLFEVCNYMVMNGERFEPGETATISPRTRIRFVRPEPIPGGEDHYEVERLQIVDFLPICDSCGLDASERN